MQAFKFSNKQQPKTYTIFTIISIIIGIFIFWSLDNLKISSSFAYLIVTIISFISIMMSIKKAGKTFKEIIVDENEVSFYFLNQLKDKRVIDVNKIKLIEKDSFIEIIEKDTRISIGIGYKNRIENKDKWDLLLECLKNNNLDV